MAQNHTVKNIDGIIREYDLLLMEANRKNIMLSVALGEVQDENEFLKEEMEKLKAERNRPQPDLEDPARNVKNPNHSKNKK